MLPVLPDFLPGRLALQRGSPRDYVELEAFHYLPKRPATWAQVWTIRYHEKPAELRSAANWGRGNGSRVVAVGVLSYPVPSSHARERHLGREQFTRRENLVFANQHIRTISRVVVHPQFRSLVLSTILVRCLCENCPTRYVESIAMMARAHPFFEKAGMRRIDPVSPDEPVYFVFDREEGLATESQRTQRIQDKSDSCHAQHARGQVI